MPFNFQFYDAGHQYGFDYLPVTTAQINYFDTLIGTPVSETTSWGNTEPSIGQTLYDSIGFSGGFTAKIMFTVTSSSTATVSAITYSRTATNELLFSATGNLYVNIYDLGSAMDESRILSGADVINGSAYNNVFKGYSGNDRIDGGAGIDTAYFSGFKSQYQIVQSGNALTVTGLDGADTLVNIERLQFDDKAIAFDIDGNSGQAYRLYQAAFDRQPDAAGLATWIKYMDDGHTLKEVSAMFQQSTEFITKYGTNVSAGDFVTLLYQNVLDRAPDAGGLSTWTNLLDTSQWSRADVLIGFSESTENKAALIGVQQGGMEYILTV